LPRDQEQHYGEETLNKAAEIQVRSVIDAWAQAIRVKDAAGVVAHQAQDLVQFDLAPPLRVVGADPRGLQDWFATWRGHGDDIAFCYGLIHLTGNRTDGSESNVWFRNTLYACARPTMCGRSPMPRVCPDLHERKLQGGNRP